MINPTFPPNKSMTSPGKNVFDWDSADDDLVLLPNPSSPGQDVGYSPLSITMSSLSQPIFASAAATGTLVTAGGISFDLLYDAAALAAPAAFRAGIEQAATLLAQVISDKITVNLQIHFSGTGGGASAKPDNGLFETYSSIRTDLVNAATAGDPTFNGLPNATSIQGQTQVLVPNSELKLFGLLSANDTTTDDGEATFATDIGSSVLVGVALHELTHALGRVPFGPQPDIFDLFRFTSAGTRLLTSSIPSAAAYFSIDNGATKLADFGQSSDPSDFLNSGVQGPTDPFNEFYNAGTTQSLSGVDLEIMDALGFHVHTAGSLSISLANDSGVASADALTNDATLTGAGTPNATVTLTENGATIGTATVSASAVWTYKPSLGDGQHTIVVSEAGVSSQPSVTFTLATHAPSLAAAESVSGQTTQTSDVITVTAVAEAVGTNAISRVEIFDGGADLGGATFASGAWTYAAGNLQVGAHNFTAKAYDSAGNSASTALATVAVTGTAPPANGKYTLANFGFARSDTTVTDIRAKSINDLGEVVGYYIDGRPDDVGADGLTYFEHGFYSTLSSGVRAYAGIDNPDAPLDSGADVGIDRTRAFGVNNNGDIVGWYGQDEIGLSSAGNPYILPDAGYIMAAQWPGTFGKLGFSALNDLGTHTLGINSSDQIVGYYVDGAGEQHGFLRAFTGYGNRGGYVSLDPANSINTIAEGINDSNVIVGYYETSDLAYHGFSYNSSTSVYTPIDINGATSTQVLGVNNSGETVGAYLDSAGKRHGFVRSAGGQFTTIDDPNAGAGGTLVGGINNLGEIVGWYTGADGHDHSFTGAPAPAAPKDFNGDGKSDILWRNTNGTVAAWDSSASGAYAYAAIGTLDSSWQIAGIADFNGDGMADMLLRNTNGAVGAWESAGAGAYAYVGIGSLDSTWQIAGVGDFNGDGKADILLRNTNGSVGTWSSSASGAYAYAGIAAVDSSWQIAGTGDFNGDGKADVLWRNTSGAIALWDSSPSGNFGFVGIGVLDSSWQVAGTGDFNGDGKADILWRNSNGAAYLWNSNGSGGFTGQSVGVLDASWQVAGVGDFDGSGTADILWRNSNGAAYIWNSNGSGGFTGQGLGVVPTSWSIQA